MAGAVPQTTAGSQIADRTLGRHGSRQQTWGWSHEMWDDEEAALYERHHDQSPAARPPKWCPAGAGCRQETRQGSDVKAAQGSEVWARLSEHPPTGELPPSRRGVKQHTCEGSRAPNQSKGLSKVMKHKIAPLQNDETAILC
ncbi:unnamed protein product [Lampetra planeri]